MSAHPLHERVLALAGLMQSVCLVQHIAQQGVDGAPGLEASLASIFRLDADSVEAVYGHASLVRPGLETLAHHLEGGPRRDVTRSRIAVTVLHVERKLARKPELLRAIGEGVQDIERQRELLGITHATVLGRLGDLYAATVSTLSPRVLVQGNPLQLSQTQVVAQVRAVLLAAMRSAVLWRQLDGSYWDLLLRRRAMLVAAHAWIEGSARDSGTPPR